MESISALNFLSDIAAFINSFELGVQRSMKNTLATSNEQRHKYGRFHKQTNLKKPVDAAAST